MQLAIAASAEKLVVMLQQLSVPKRLADLSQFGKQLCTTRRQHGSTKRESAKEECCSLLVAALKLFHLLSMEEPSSRTPNKNSKFATTFHVAVTCDRVHLPSCMGYTPPQARVYRSQLQSCCCVCFTMCTKSTALSQVHPESWHTCVQSYDLPSWHAT